MKKMMMLIALTGVSLHALDNNRPIHAHVYQGAVMQTQGANVQADVNDIASQIIIAGLGAASGYAIRFLDTEYKKETKDATAIEAAKKCVEPCAITALVILLGSAYAAFAGANDENNVVRNVALFCTTHLISVAYAKKLLVKEELGENGARAKATAQAK